MKSSLLPLALGPCTRNAAYYLQDYHQTIRGWGEEGWSKDKVKCQKALLPSIHCIFWSSICLVAVNLCFPDFCSSWLEVVSRFYLFVFLCFCGETAFGVCNCSIFLPLPTKVFMAHVNVAYFWYTGLPLLQESLNYLINMNVREGFTLKTIVIKYFEDMEVFFRIA